MPFKCGKDSSGQSMAIVSFTDLGGGMWTPFCLPVVIK
jgi:hypothetical protein